VKYIPTLELSWRSGLWPSRRTSRDRKSANVNGSKRCSSLPRTSSFFSEVRPRNILGGRCDNRQ